MKKISDAIIQIVKNSNRHVSLDEIKNMVLACLIVAGWNDNETYIYVLDNVLAGTRDCF